MACHTTALHKPVCAAQPVKRITCDAHKALGYDIQDTDGNQFVPARNPVCRPTTAARAIPRTPEATEEARPDTKAKLPFCNTSSASKAASAGSLHHVLHHLAVGPFGCWDAQHQLACTQCRILFVLHRKAFEEALTIDMRTLLLESTQDIRTDIQDVHNILCSLVRACTM